MSGQQMSAEQALSAEYDLIIVGAGLAGTALACCLQSLSLRILLLDQVDPISFDTDIKYSRPLSLADSSCRLLQRLGLWESGLEATSECESGSKSVLKSESNFESSLELKSEAKLGSEAGLTLAQHASPIEQVHVSEQKSFFHTLFDAKEYQLKALGYVVPAHLLQACLAQRALAAVDFVKIKQLVSSKRVPVPCSGQKQEGDLSSAARSQIHLTYTNQQGEGTSVRANLLIGADGAASKVRALGGFSEKTKQQKAVAICAQLEVPLQGRAYERFVTSGPGGVLALLPQGARHAGMVWVMSEQQAALTTDWSDDDWQRALSAAMSGHVSQPIIFKKRTASYPLQTKIVAEPARNQIILIGNAAHTLYPLAAQGFNLSLRDVATLAELLAEQYQTGQGLQSLQCDRVSATLCKQYQVRVKADLARIEALTDGLVRLMNMPNIPGLRQMRSLGMLALGLCLPAKTKVAMRCLGRAGSVPRLMRGLNVLSR